MAGDPVIVAGFGFRALAGVESLADALSRVEGPAVDAIATAEDKARTPAFLELAARLGVPVLGVDADALARVHTSTISTASQAARQTGSLAEAAALAAAGPNARLLATRIISGDRFATCALAQGE